jgi:spermidine synthase
LFWVLPFALYLLTFIIAFAWRSRRGQYWILLAQAAGIIAVLATTILTVAYGLGGSVGAMVGVHVFAFFTTALMCHGELARRRPAASGLTTFYFCMSIGGALGGIFNALIAPALFSTDLEYYLALVAACAVRGFAAGDARSFHWRDALFPLLLGLLVALVVYYATSGPTPLILTRFLFLFVCSMTLYWFSERSNRFALGVAAMLTGILVVENTVDLVHTQRSFFGISKIWRMEKKGLVTLTHGTTMHGAEFIDRARRDEPLTYYAHSGPLGQALAHAGPRPRAVLIGLGTGALACYREPPYDWTFFEIDAAMEKIARDTRFFHYLDDCKGAKVKLGDGRLLLQKEPDRGYDLIVVDAFSSDSIPTHLITREALALYLRKLKPGGIILFHLSNKYLRLAPVLSDGIASVGAFARRQYYSPSEAEDKRGAVASDWMVIAGAQSDLDFLGHDKRWERVQAGPDPEPWTDDFSNIFRVIVW